MAVNDEDASLMPYDDEIVYEVTDRLTVLPITNLSPSQIFDVQSAALPCLDCETVVVHASHCWIGGM